jgi:iron complex transport system permease protein
MGLKKLVPLALILAIVIIISVGVGAVSIPPLTTLKVLLHPYFNIINRDWPSSYNAIINTFRFPRVVLAMIVGMSLSTAGVTYQSIFKNPMADPFILGASAGAALGASISIYFRLQFKIMGISSITLLAFIGAITAILIAYFISRVGGRILVSTLLLSGIAVSSFFSAIVTIVTYYSGDRLGQIIFWIMGSFSSRTWHHVSIVLPYFLISLFVFIILSRDMNILVLGEETAQYLGINVEMVKGILLVSATLTTAASVSVTGIIGFVGLIIPHITRLLVGPDHRVLIPASALVGGIFMVLTDTISRTILTHEIPVGIITSLLGAPFFIYLLKNRFKE